MGNEQVFPEETLLSIKNDLMEIKTVHSFLANMIKDKNISSRTLFHLQLACEELITNTIKYGFPDGKEHQLLIQCKIDHDQIILRIIDDGIPFNPLKQTTPNTTLSIEERPIGGLGLYFAKRTMDEMVYQRTDKQNILVLTKKIMRRDMHGDSNQPGRESHNG